jgi:hypothetical protein
VEEISRAAFDGALAEGGVFLLTMHPHDIGHRSRIALLEHLNALGKVWFATHAQLVGGARNRRSFKPPGCGRGRSPARDGPGSGNQSAVHDVDDAVAG